MSSKHLLVLILTFVAFSLSLIAFARVTEAAPTPSPRMGTQFDLPLDQPAAPPSVLL